MTTNLPRRSSLENSALLTTEKPCCDEREKWRWQQQPTVTFKIKYHNNLHQNSTASLTPPKLHQKQQNSSPLPKISHLPQAIPPRSSTSPKLPNPSTYTCTLQTNTKPTCPPLHVTPPQAPSLPIPIQSQLPNPKRCPPSPSKIPT